MILDNNPLTFINQESILLYLYYREVQKAVKRDEKSDDGEPAAKKSKIQHTEAVTVKKV